MTRKNTQFPSHRHHPLTAMGTAMAACCLIVGCQTPPVIPTPATADLTSPELRLGSAGLMADFTINAQSTASQERRAKRADQILISASAEDPDSGIRDVSLQIEIRRTCGTSIQTESLNEVRTPTAVNGLPARLDVYWTLDVAQHRTACAVVPAELRVSVQAKASNGSGLQTALPDAIVRSYGPDLLRVATFNLFQPGNHADPVYSAWGLNLGSLADVLLMTEVPDLRRAQLVAQAAGLPHVHKMGQGDLAIAARWPLRDIRELVIDPPGWLSSNNSSILGATVDIGGWPHQFIATHWGIRDANDVLAPPGTPAPARLQAAQAIGAMALAPPSEVFIGGDLNAYSGFGPQEPPGSRVSTQEVDWLRARFSDAFTAMQKADSDHCSNQRIDYVMARAAYTPVLYDACRDGSPSDHPFVLVHYAAGP